MSAHYERLIKPSREPDDKIRERIHRLNRWGGQTMYPFLLWVYSQLDAGKINAPGVAEILSIIESFLVRRMFCGIPTNALNRLFTRLAQQLPSEKPIVEATRAALSEPGRRWPRDAEFRKAIQTYPLYTDSRAEQRKMILETIESSYGHKEHAVFNNLTVEHIMPQTLTPEWRAMLGEKPEDTHRKYVHTLGNLSLTGYNPDMSNKPFEEKRTFLVDSHVAMNKEIAESLVWTANEIQSRAECLAEKALGIWPGPLEI